MQIVHKNNNNFSTPKSANKIQSPINKEICNKIYDEEFVSLINSLNESIKEYYKVSKNNIIEANNILDSYQQQAQIINNLIIEINNTSSYEKLDELFDLTRKTLEVIIQMKMNSNSNNKNLGMFFDDAKILFKSMKSKRKEKLMEINNDISKQNNQPSSDSYVGSFNSENKFNNRIDNNNYMKMNNNNINMNMNTNNEILIKNINAIYSRVIKILNNFSIYNYVISKVDFEESNKYNNLQNSLKKELENLFIILKKNLSNQAKSLVQAKSCTDIKEKINNNRSKSRPHENELENLKMINESNKKKLMELNNQLNFYRNKVKELEMKNNSMIIKLKNFEQTKYGFQNNNQNAYNELNKKDMQILNLQKQLKVFQVNENSLNDQINNLNDQFAQKINEYEYERANLSQTILSQKKTLSNLQNNLNMKQKELENLKESAFKENNNNYDLDKKLEIMNMELKEKQSKINALTQDIKNYQRKEMINQEQIENMNNNIFNYEKIIKEKDDLINNNYKDNNDVFKIKLENEKLKKQIEELKNANNNNYIQNQKMINGNINSYEIPGNQGYITRINELTQENQELKQSLSLINESKTKLELELSKKKDELEGYKQVIFKLQNKLEQNNDIEEELKKRLNTERNVNAYNNKTDMNLREQNQSNKNLNKSFEMPKDANIQLMNKYLGQLNEAEKKISLLQNKNKELQFKLDEKQVEREFSGYRTEDYNFSNYEEEFDLKKMVNGAREKNRSEDINIDYPGVQSVKDKYKELLQNMHLLEEQVKILISNINISNKIKPQISQICQLMRIKAENIQAIIAGKDKKKNLGLI